MSAAVQAFRDRALIPGPVPADVLAYWRAKSLRVGFDYRDVWNEEHDYGFSAAKIMRRDVLAALHEELGRAVEQGIPFEAWRKAIEPRFRALGWWDEHTVTDPQMGNVAKVTPPERLRTIFQTNMRTARAVGQWDRVQRAKRTRPYLLYQVGPSARHREQHLEWHGLLLSVDDPFWEFAFPPNGWGCKCSVRAVSASEADELATAGVLAPTPEPALDEEGNPTGHVLDQRVAVRRQAPRVPLVPWHNKRSGQVEFVPKGVDPGFHHRPGVGRALALVAAEE